MALCNKYFLDYFISYYSLKDNFFKKKKINLKEFLNWILISVFLIVFYILYFNFIFPSLVLNELKKECLKKNKDDVEDCVQKELFSLGEKIKQRYLKDKNEINLF